MKLKLLQKILGLTTVDEIIDLLNQPENTRIMIDIGYGVNDTLPSTLKIIVDYLFFLKTKRKSNKKNTYAFFTIQGKLFVNEFFETEDIAYKFKQKHWKVFEKYQSDNKTHVKLDQVLNDTPNLFRLMCILIIYAGTGLHMEVVFSSAYFNHLYGNQNILNISGCKNLGASNDPVIIELNSALYECPARNPDELISAKINILKKIQKLYSKYCSYIKSSSSDLIKTKDPITEEFLKIELPQKNSSSSTLCYFYKDNYITAAIDYEKNRKCIQSIFVVENNVLVETQTPKASTLKKLSSIRDFSFNALSCSYSSTKKYNPLQLTEVVNFLTQVQTNISGDIEKKELFANAISILKTSCVYLVNDVNRIILTLLQIMPYPPFSKHEDFFISIKRLQPIREVEQLPTIINSQFYSFEEYFSLRPIREVKNFKRTEYNLTTQQVFYKEILSIIYGHPNLIDYGFLCDPRYRAEAFNDVRQTQEYYQEHDKLLFFNIFISHLKKIKEFHDKNPGLLIEDTRNWLLSSGPRSHYLKEAVISIIGMSHKYIHAEFVTIWIKHHCSDKGFELKQLYNQKGFLEKMQVLAEKEYAPAQYFLFEFYKDVRYLSEKSSYPPILHALGLIYAAKVIPHARRRIAEEWGEHNVVNILSNFAWQNDDDAQITCKSFSYLLRAARKEYIPAQYDLSLFLWCITPVGREEISEIRNASYQYLEIAAMKDYEPAIRLWTILTQRYEFSSLRPLPILPHEISLKIANYVYPDKEAKLDYVLGEEKTFNLWITKMLELLKWELAFYYRDEYALKKHYN